MLKTASTSENFLGLGKDRSSFDSARAIILPAPYASPSRRDGGVRKGPAAVVAASRALSAFDEESGHDLAAHAGIATLLPPAPPTAKFESILTRVHDIVTDLLSGGKFPVLIGGTQSLTSACVAAHAKRSSTLSVLRFDAHASMRSDNAGDKYSPLCSLRRISEIVEPRKVVAVGLRSMSQEESESLKDLGISTYHAHNIRTGSYTRLLKYWDDQVLDDLAEEVYVSVDVDVFDPSIMPSTLSPEPNGLQWFEVSQCIRKIAQKRRIVGCDVVGLAPRTDLRHPDIAVAGLILKTLHHVL